jgi:hypothetical protein
MSNWHYRECKHCGNTTPMYRYRCNVCNETYCDACRPQIGYGAGEHYTGKCTTCGEHTVKQINVR